MSIFFPDNKKRQSRLLELSSDSQVFLHEAKNDYARFKELTTQVNAKIAQVYEKSGLTPPGSTSLNILEIAGVAQSVATADTVVEVTDILLDVGGLVATTAYLAPAATSLLVETGVMEAETAAVVMGSVLGTEITIGALAGGLVGGLIAGVVVVGIGLAIDAIEGAILRDKLRHGIHKLDQVRATLKLSLDRAGKVVEVLESVKRTLDGLLASNVPLTDQVIRNLLVKDAKPAIAAINAITMSTVRVELNKLDHSRRSWTVEDNIPHEVRAPHPHRDVFIVAQVPYKAHPDIPADLKLTGDPCPVIKSNGYTYWAYSYRDNRVGIAIVAYDIAGNQIKRWDKSGARYITSITSNPVTNQVIFTGQSNQKITVSWDELGTILGGGEIEGPISIKKNYVWLQEEYTLPITFTCNVACHSQSDEFLPCFSQTRAQWASPDCDALSWYLSPHRHDFTFRTKLFREFPSIERFSPGLNAEVGRTYKMRCEIGNSSATYWIDDKKYATANYSPGAVPGIGYIGFAVYGVANIAVRDITITPT